VKLVATSDTHFAFGPMEDGDVFLHAGDAMYSGYVTEWARTVESFAAQPHKTKILVPGNHDIHIQVYPGPALAELRAVGVEVLGIPHTNTKTTLPNGMTVGGCPFVSNLPRWAFNEDETFVWQYLEAMGRVDILVAHSPPRGCLDRGAGNGGHYGLGALRKYITRYQPSVLICGHVHEQYGHSRLERTDVYNVSHCNLDYKQVNPPIVLEFPDA
jgi:Icc-related predicted phosphoesterase